MDNTNYKLTDEEVQQIENVLEENKSDEVKEMEEAISQVEVDPDAPLEEGDINITMNEIGKPIQVAASEDETDTSIYADLFEDGNIPEVDFNKEEVKDDLVIKAAMELLNCNKSEANKFLDIIKEYKSLTDEERKDYQAYIKLPESFRRQINRITGGTKTYRNEIAKNFIESIIKESVFDKELENVKDLMGSIAKELDLSNTVDMYTKYQKGLMEDNLKAHADKIRAEGDIEKADKLDKISAAYHESYTFEDLKNEIINNGGRFKIKPIEIEKIESRVFDSFNRKYIKSEFNIPNIIEAMKIATEKLTEYEVKDIMKFFIVFCKYCKDYTPDNVEQHTFMYYTLMNIISLNFEDVNEDNEFANNIRKSLSEVIDLIKERY